MSLLLDARKKSQQTQGPSEPYSSLDISLEEAMGTAPAVPGSQPDAVDNERARGNNLFQAKTLPHNGINRNLLFALGGTILFLLAGAGYWWYLDSANNTTPPYRVKVPPQALPAPALPMAAPTFLPAASGITGKDSTLASQAAMLPEKLERNIPVTTQQPAKRNIVQPQIEHQQAEPVDPLLSSAYQAYQAGRYDEAQQLYQSLLKKEPRTPDALLGLAAIAQQRGDAQLAAHYYTRVLVLDPRNALANAGLSAFSGDVVNNESRLKTLLSEQGDSAALHFALGNLYAEQARWGEAQQAYFDAYTLESGSAEYAFNLAVSLDHLGQARLAAQHYQRALQLDPSNHAGLDRERISQRIQQLTR
ncbi:MAG: tetratricopeptide repeat protein [Nitrosomonadales bacterium]|nr:tetratricopeptide repeat protein [Nitrosomonadales bacterium]